MVLLLGFGGWLSALPLLGAISLLVGNAHDKPAVLILVGAGLIGMALTLLRGLQGRLLLEQGAVPCLLAGGWLVTWGLSAVVPNQLAAALLAALAAAVAWQAPQHWLKSVLGATAAAALMFAFNTQKFMHSVLWLVLHAEVAVWLLAARLLATPLSPARSEGMDAWFGGWLASVLAALCIWSGTSFMAGDLLFLGGEPAAGERVASDVLRSWLGPWLAAGLCALSVLMGAAACALLARSLPVLRQRWCAGVAATLLVFTWFMPALGGVLLVLAVCAVLARYKFAVAAALAAAWVIGSAYYQLSWSLNQKAAVFALAGVLVAAFSWRALHAAHLTTREDASNAALAAADDADAVGVGVGGGAGSGGARRAGTGIVLTLLAALLISGITVWRNETLIAGGDTVFVELAPVDPRSLVQGDYMRLAVRMPPDMRTAINASGIVIGVRDQRNIVQLQRMDDGKPLAPKELRIVLQYRNGSWLLASDAWFFEEGHAQRYAKARYGEYKVGKDGRALLTGLRGPALEEL